MGWAQGFKLGSDMARNWIDTYEESKRGVELEKIRTARPEESMGYTAEQGQELEAIARAVNPETGQAYYQIEAIPGTAQYRVTPNFQTTGEDGQPQRAMPVEMSPQKVTDYLGRRYAGELAPEQQERAQYRAMADVVAQANPEQAARLRMAISQDERAEKEFGQTSTLRGLQIDEAKGKQEVRTKLSQLFEKSEKDLADARTVFNTKGLQGGAEELKRRGLPVRFNNGVIEVLDPKGKVVDTISDVGTALTKVEEVIQQDMTTQMAVISQDPNLIRQVAQDRFSRGIQTRELKIKEDQNAREAEAAPLARALTKAQIAKVTSDTEGNNLEQADKKEYRNIRTEIITILQNPTPENQAKLQQLARRAAILNPKEVLVTKTYTDANGIAQTITTNVFTNEVQKSAGENRVPNKVDWDAAQKGINSKTGKPLTEEEKARWNTFHGPEYQISTKASKAPTAATQQVLPAGRSPAAVAPTSGKPSLLAQFEKLEPMGNRRVGPDGRVYESNLPSFGTSDKRIDPVTGQPVTFGEYVRLLEQRNLAR
jgi:rubrerythrin